MEEDVINVEGLNKLLKALKAKPPIVRIGILGNSSPRNDKSGQTNASIGAEHEFGSSKMPRRSFLRVPLSDHLDKQIQASGLLDEDSLKKVIKVGSVIPWLKTIAKIAEGVVKDAFNSNGYGQWQALSPKYSEWKNKKYGTGNILVATQQLRESITSEVVE